jgi:ubiquinone/menaquinone biosynthesis C-methylase UbiE
MPLTAINKWFPVRPNVKSVKVALEQFYESSEAYHAMTRNGDKTTHPQVRLLMSLLRAGGTYVEVGCGGGTVCKEVGKYANVVGVDVSPVAIGYAKELCAGLESTVTLACGPAECIALGDSCADGVYSFEVLEHLWDPIVALKEMIRIAKPGGFILISIPNGFSMDLHLRKRFMARCLDIVFAAVRRLLDSVSGRVYWNVKPVLEGAVYPDCDMITAVVPANLVKWLEGQGCSVIFWDTFYMNAHILNGKAGLPFQKYSGRAFFKHFGDHLLMYAEKR